MARTGRRPGDPDTRGTILAAARSTFASAGYHGATIRAIAAEAGVDPALVHHYFTTKQGLFTACVQLPMQPEEIGRQIIDGGLDGAGRRTATIFFTTWEQPATRDALLTMLRASMSPDAQSNALREFFGGIMRTQIGPHLSGPDIELRMGLAVSHLLGAALLRHAVRFPGLGDVDPDRLAAMVGDAIQPYFTPDPDRPVPVAEPDQLA